jgi:hypothetical protein
MPEVPDLYVIRDYFEANLTGLTIAKAEVLRPIVLRSLAVSPEELPDDRLGGRSRASGVEVSSLVWSSRQGQTVPSDCW